VQAVIQSRLGQLSAPARELAEVAAAAGREFTVELLERATRADDAELIGGLDELWRRRIIADHGPDAYDFTHDKIREVAYRALSPPRRRHLHLRVAEALETLHAHDPAPVSGELAVQYDRAGEAYEAVMWYRRAAEAALELYASADAVRLLERALELVSDPDRELALITAALGALGFVEGYGSSRLAELHRRALELEDEPDPVLLRSLALAALTRGDFEDAARAGEQLRERAERDGDAVMEVEGHYALGVAAFWRSDLHAARRHFEAAVGGYRVEHRPTHLIRYGLDPQVVCLSRLANTLGFLGRRAAAVDACERALALAREIDHDPTLSTALVFAALLALDLGDEPALRRHTAELRRRTGAVKAAVVTADCLAGYLDVLDGRTEAGLAVIRRVLDDVSEPGHAPGSRESLVHLLVEACSVAGDHRGGLEATELPLRIRLWEPETLARRAEFLEALGAPGADVAAARRAADAARNARGTPGPASSSP
jgi:tetratricopeptide (TPR) repeat protein